MATPFIPPWLQNVGDPVANYAKGLQLGEQIDARNAQQWQRMQELNAQRQQAAQRINAEIEMQRARIEQEQAQLAQERQLKERALALAESEAQIPAEQAAMQFQGQRMYQDTLARLVQGGMDEEEARRQAMLTAAPTMLGGRNAAALPRTLEALAKPGKPEAMDFGEGMPRAVIDPRGVPHWPPGTGTTDEINPETTSVTHPITGEPMGTFVKTGPRSGSFVSDKETPESRAQRTRIMSRLKTNESKLADAEVQLANAPAGTKTYEATVKLIDSLTEKISKDEEALKSKSSPVASGTPKVTTRDEFDALPSGAVYTGKDGRKYRKP